MKKSDLKKLIKPIVKECIQESLLEDGVLSKVISEVTRGLSSTTIVENVSKQEVEKETVSNQREAKALASLKEHRQKMLDAIGKDSMNGVDIFEGTDPLSSSGEVSPGAPKGALSGVDPRDPGVDISDLAGIFGETWKVIKNG